MTSDRSTWSRHLPSKPLIAIENVKQFKALEALNAELGDRVEKQVGEIERMGHLKRFLPAAVADTVVSQGSEKILSSHRALLGVLFCDIRGFTAFCETAEPEETIEVLQIYHEEMGNLINAYTAQVLITAWATGSWFCSMTPCLVTTPLAMLFALRWRCVRG